MFLCRIDDYKVLTMGSMNFIERELQDLTPDILLAGAGSSRVEIYKYTERLLAATAFPKIVIPTHWDNFYVPYDDEAAQIQAKKEKVESFVKEVAAISPESQIIVPAHLKPIVIRNGSVEF